MEGSVSIPFPRQNSRSSSSLLPVMSNPVFSRIASVMVTLRYGALKSISLSPTITLVEPFTSMAIFSSIRSVKRIIQL